MSWLSECSKKILKKIHEPNSTCGFIIFEEILSLSSKFARDLTTLLVNTLIAPGAQYWVPYVFLTEQAGILFQILLEIFSGFHHVDLKFKLLTSFGTFPLTLPQILLQEQDHQHKKFPRTIVLNSYRIEWIKVGGWHLLRQGPTSFERKPVD